MKEKVCKCLLGSVLDKRTPTIKWRLFVSNFPVQPGGRRREEGERRPKHQSTKINGTPDPNNSAKAPASIQMLHVLPHIHNSQHLINCPCQLHMTVDQYNASPDISVIIFDTNASHLQRTRTPLSPLPHPAFQCSDYILSRSLGYIASSSSPRPVAPGRWHTPLVYRTLIEVST